MWESNEWAARKAYIDLYWFGYWVTQINAINCLNEFDFIWNVFFFSPDESKKKKEQKTKNKKTNYE